MQEGLQLPPLLKKIKALREAGLRVEHVAFSFMKRRVQPLMACDHLGCVYTGDEDSSLMPGEEVEDDIIIERLGKSSRTCMRTRRAQYRSPLRHGRQARLVVVVGALEY
jgi:hypothetical protein